MTAKVLTRPSIKILISFFDQTSVCNFDIHPPMPGNVLEAYGLIEGSSWDISCRYARRFQRANFTALMFAILLKKTQKMPERRRSRCSPQIMEGISTFTRDLPKGDDVRERTPGPRESPTALPALHWGDVNPLSTTIC